MDNDHSTPEASVDPIDEIASLLLGEDDDSGDVEADTPEQTNAKPDTEDEPADAEEPSEDSTEEDGGDVESDTTDDDDDDDDDSEDKTLAEMLGVDESQLSVLDDGEFMLNVKIDGKQTQHSLADVVKNYQTEGSITNKSKALAEDKRNFEHAAATKAQEIKDTLAHNQRLTGLLEQELMSDYEKEDWENLRQYDPAEWSAKRQEYATKYQRVQQVKGELNGQVDQAAEAQRLQNDQRKQANLKDQWATMIGNNPTWSDKKVYDADMAGIRKDAADAYGFEDSDFTGVSDARLIEVLKDAVAYRKGATVAKKKLKSVPKVQKRSASRKGKKVSRLDKLTNAAKRASGSNKRDLQTAAVAELLMGG